MKLKRMKIYTDGSSLGNPGSGGWGIIFLANKKVMEKGYAYKNVTNNQMELMALKRAMEILVEKNVEGYEIEFMVDSKYVIDGIEKWIYSWIKNDWKKSDKKPVLNKELWQGIYNPKKILEAKNKFLFTHVKAHNGEKFNERVDDIARGFAESGEVELFTGKEGGYFEFLGE